MPGSRAALTCARHKIASHVDVRSRRCAEPGCSRQPSFYNLSETSILLCSRHAKGRERREEREERDEPGAGGERSVRVDVRKGREGGAESTGKCAGKVLVRLGRRKCQVSSCVFVCVCVCVVCVLCVCCVCGCRQRDEWRYSCICYTHTLSLTHTHTLSHIQCRCTLYSFHYIHFHVHLHIHLHIHLIFIFMCINRQRDA